MITRQFLRIRHAAIAELGYEGLRVERKVVLENTAKIHNLVVCTLCSCY